MKKVLTLLIACLLSISLYSQLVSHEDMLDFVNTNIISGGAKLSGHTLNTSFVDIIASRQALYYDVTKPYVQDSSVVLHNSILYRCIIDNIAAAFDPLDWKAITSSDADSLRVENISAFTDTTKVDSFFVFHDEVGMNAQAVTGIPLSIAGTDDVIVSITGSADTSIHIVNTATGTNTIGLLSTADGGTNSDVGVEGLAGLEVKTIAALSYVGVLGEAGSSTLNNFGISGTSITPSIGTNIGGRFNAENGGAGVAYPLQLLNGNDNTDHMLRTVSSLGYTEWGILRDNGDTIFCDSVAIFGDTVRINSELFVTENIDILDDKELILSSDDAKSLSYNTNTGGIHFKSTGNEQMTFTNGITFSANTGNDGLGIYSPEIKLLDAGINIDATSAAATKIVRLLCPDGLSIAAGGTKIAILSTVRLAITGKTFDFPNVSGIFAVNSIFATASEVGGSGDVITIDFPTNVTVSVPLEITFVAEANNTGATTINIDGAGAIAIFEASDISDLEANDIRSTMIVKIVYDGTQWQQISQSGN